MPIYDLVFSESRTFVAYNFKTSLTLVTIFLAEYNVSISLLFLEGFHSSEELKQPYLSFVVSGLI